MTVSSAPLPSSIPGVIYPPTGAPDTSDLDGFSLASILFQDTLSWETMLNSQVDQSDMFAFFPDVLLASLNLNGKSIHRLKLE